MKRATLRLLLKKGLKKKEYAFVIYKVYKNGII